MTFEAAFEKLKTYGQEHVLKYYDSLSDSEKSSLLEQIDSTDFSVISCLERKGELGKKGTISPLPAMQIEEIEAQKEHFRKTGLEAIKAGKVGAVLLAGGMGTRLGSDDPKGMYNIGITREVFIFQRLIDNLMEVVKEAGTWIPLYVMTSDKNHLATTSFLKEKEYFGYHPDYVFFFQQEMAPATDYQGKIFLEKPYKMSTSPNGNGGWFISMDRAGILDHVHESGVEWLNVFAVDNVLQRIADPVFVGATIEKNVEVGSKVVKKNAPDEKVGVMCLEDGRPSIIEYYELSDEMRDAKLPNGEPAYNFGVTLNYLFHVKELDEIVGRSLPLHVVKKKIAHIDSNGNPVDPDQPNGHKYETLILDMIHMLDGCLVFEVDRKREFAPVKNRTGVDSVDSARELLTLNGVML